MKHLLQISAISTSKFLYKDVPHNWHAEVGNAGDAKQKEREAFYKKVGQELDEAKNEINPLSGSNLQIKANTSEVLSIQFARAFGEPTDSWKTKDHPKTFYLLHKLTELGYNVDKPQSISNLTIDIADGKISLLKNGETKKELKPDPIATEKAKEEAEAEAKRKAEEKTRKEAEELKTRLEKEAAEKKVKAESEKGKTPEGIKKEKEEAEAKRKAEEAKKLAEEKAKEEAAEKARKEAEAKAKRKAEEAEKSKVDTEKTSWEKLRESESLSGLPASFKKDVLTMTVEDLKSTYLYPSENDGNLPKGYKRSHIIADFRVKEAKNNKAQWEGKDLRMANIGSFFEISNSAKVSQITSTENKDLFNADNTLNYSNIESKMDTPAMIVSGGYTVSGSPDGVYRGDGRGGYEVIGVDNTTEKGLLITPKNGKPFIAYVGYSGKGTNPSSGYFENISDVFKEYPDAVVSRQMSILRDGSTLTSGNKVNEWRFFTETADGRTGIVNFVVKMSLFDASNALKAMGIKRAVHLDGGPESHGKFYDKTGKRYAVGDENYKESNYSTALVLH